MPIPLRASTPTDLLSLIPHLVHFHVDDGVVVLICSGRAVEVTMRFDYELFDTPVAVRDTLERLLARVPEPRVFLAGFGPDRERADDALGVLEALVGADDIIDSVYTDGQRWWSRLCTGACCPAEGTPCDPLTPVATAAAVEAGSRPLASRAELERSVQGPSLVEQGATLGVLDEVVTMVGALEADERAQRMYRRVRRFVADQAAELGDEEALELAVLAGDIEARDRAWLQMSQASARRHVALWTRVVQVAPDRWATPALCLLASAAWLQGHGALMGCCLERAERLDPDYSMLGILLQVYHGMAHPAMWEEIRAGVG